MHMSAHRQERERKRRMEKTMGRDVYIYMQVLWRLGI